MAEHSERRRVASGLVWRKSSASEQEECFEIAVSWHAVLVRDSKSRSGAALAFPREGWEDFLEKFSR
ncbi:DUF397 domain-containing protein [Actinophytocola sp.]|uniref:DUF397 domain-containing protein n=1 Tax=Actinophytocola sp. TaxID=1872138 RepID=UPI003D6C19B5